MLNPDFKELLQLFNDKNIEYLVVGGYAMAAHGYPRYTGDIDLWVWSTQDNAIKILDALREFGFGGAGLKEEDFQKPQQVIQLGFPPARIDLLTDIDGVTFADCWPQRLVLDLDGVSVPVIGKSDLIRNKETSNRLQDRADLEKLR
jgi:hypothetical protein